MMIREPVVAGRFYPADREGVLRQIAAMRVPEEFPKVPDRPVGGIVPHAGWVFSGETAYTVLSAIHSRRAPHTFVLFGATHRPVLDNALFPEGAWRTPLGDVRVDERLAGEILARAAAENLVQADPNAHEGEHSIEVQLPLIQHLFPDAQIVPILVPGDDRAVALGRMVGNVIRDRRADAVCLGSSDLTHYGPMYGFTPKGMGEAALRWVRDENDRRILDLIAGLKAEQIVPEARDHLNACGSGAIAATLAAVGVLGAIKGIVLCYTTSFDIMQEQTGRADYEAAVGYPGVVF